MVAGVALGGLLLLARLAAIGFGAGPRACPGGTFGMTEAILVIASVAQRFRLRIRPDHPVEPMARLTTRPSHGLPMTIQQRG